MIGRVAAWAALVGVAAGAVIARTLTDDSLGAAISPMPANAGWIGCAALGLFAWVGGAVLFSRRAITAKDTFCARPAGLAGVIIATGAVMWLAGIKEMW